MKILFIGDVAGSPGRDMLQAYLPKLKEKYRPNLIIVNGENAAAGKGITQKFTNNFSSGVLMSLQWVITHGIKRKYSSLLMMPKYDPAANFPEGTPGKGITFVNINGTEAAVINAQGRTFLPAIDDPFKKLDELIEIAKKRTNIILSIFMRKQRVKSRQWAGIWTEKLVLWPEPIHIHRPRTSAYCPMEPLI